MALHDRTPFIVGAQMRANRAFTMNGVNYEDGDLIDTTGVELRRIRQMYDAFLIEPVMSDSLFVSAAPVQKAAQKPVEPQKAASGTDTAGEPQKAASEAATGDTKGFSLVQPPNGFGRWSVVDAEGNVVAGPFRQRGNKTAKECAQEALDALVKG